MTLYDFLEEGHVKGMSKIGIALNLNKRKISQKLTESVFGNMYPYQTFTECVSNQYTLWYVDMSDVTVSFGTPISFWVDYSCLKSLNFHK